MSRNVNFKNLTNKEFGYLTAICVDDSKSNSKHTYWKCKCVCGNTRSLQTYQLTSGKVTSCGCMNKKTKKSEIISKNRRLYSVYCSMLARCNNPKSISYKSYGAKGIKVCEEWKEYSNFYEWSINNGYDDKLSIDRIDNSKGYSPSNCRWIPLSEQAKNRTNNVLYTHNGETHIMSEWCKILGFSFTLAKSRRKEAKKKNIEPTFEYVFAPKQK
jgi:hypothetical protein